MISNFLWCVAGIMGGAIVSLIFFIIGLKRNKIAYTAGTYIFLQNYTNKIKGIELKYDTDVRISLSVSIITFKNIGNTTIEKRDFAPSYPLSISTTGKFLIDQIDGYKFFSYNKANNVSPIFNSNENGNCSHIIIDFDYIPKKDTISCYILHTGKISFSGILKEGKIISYKKYIKTHRMILFLYYLCCFIIGLFLGYIIFL